MKIFLGILENVFGLSVREPIDLARCPNAIFEGCFGMLREVSKYRVLLRDISKQLGMSHIAADS